MLEDKYIKYFTADNVGHAYLLKTTEYEKVLNIAKKIILDSIQIKSNIENLIEEQIYPDLISIEPDGQWIKKEQILELKEKFKTKSSYNSKQVYIIKNAENLNPSSANTLLKFLEEPEENIVALLITENKNKVLTTIVSRCQYIVLDSNVNDDIAIDDDIIKIIEIIEMKHQKGLFDVFSYFDKKERNIIKNELIKMIDIYDGSLYQKINQKEQEKTKNDVFDKIIKNNTIEDIMKRINALIEVVDLLDYNINIKLLIDKLIISMFGVD